MITKLAFSGYRGIEKAELDGLAPLTILVGPNGSGKSTVLEAAGVFCAGADASAGFAVMASREWLGLEGMSYWVDWKTGATFAAEAANGVSLGTVRPLEVALNHGPPVPRSFEGAPLRVIRFFAGPRGARGGDVVVDDDGDVVAATIGERILPFSHLNKHSSRPAGARKRFSAPVFSSDLREALKRMKLSPWYDDFLDYLRELRPSVISVESIAVGDRDEPFVFEGNPRRGYPIAYAGDGFARLLELAAALASAKGGIAALDEPESHAHPSMVAGLGSLIRRATREGTQVFVATHSLELVRELLAAFMDAPSDAVVIGLKLDTGVLDPVVIAGADAYRRVVEMADDLRL